MTNPLIQAFLKLKLVRREILEDSNGQFHIRETRRNEAGERLRFTYPLDSTK